MKQWTILLFFLAGIIACKKEVIEAFDGFKKPSYFPEPAYHFNTNPVTKDGFALGKKLFYDPILSSNNTISCASCHIPTSGFTQHGHRTSHGIFDQFGTRNSPPIMNLAWNNTFMWDGGINDLDLQPIAPITNLIEMGDTMSRVLYKLQHHPQYPAMFKKAFGNENITSANFLKAMSQFMVMCVSNNAKYDSVMRHETSFTSDEAAGYTIFKQKCNSCHTEPLFTDHSFRSNGLEPNRFNDFGRYNITLNEADKFKFKVPSLRNLEYTTPYFHDGRIDRVEDVITHYENRVTQLQNLDPLLMQNGTPGIRFPGDEKAKLLAFLKTLNDRTFVTDKKLQP